ncbi:MAG: hypothetical protein HXX80_05525 [Nitrososphaerales archaeon]|nr:hypothetical protein [Nitrososphaerales archaeon]
MALKGRLGYVVLALALMVWFVSLLVVYLPISKLITPTFSLPIEYDYMLIIFLASTALSSLTSFYIGLDKLRTNP